VSVFKVHVTRWMKGGRQVKAGTPGATKVRLKSRKWYGKLPGRRRRVPLSTNKSVALTMYGDLLRTAERRKAGLHVDADDWADVPLAGQVREFAAAIAAGSPPRKRPPSAFVVARTVRRVEAVLAGAGAVFARDLDAARVRAYLTGLTTGEPVSVPQKGTFTAAEAADLLGVEPGTVAHRCKRLGLPRAGYSCYPRETVAALAAHQGRGMGLTTAAAYGKAARRFTRWLHRRGRIGADPLAELQLAAPEHDGRHQRRPLSAAEMERFLAAAGRSERTHRGLAGTDRVAIYLTALSTGFRLAEVAALTPERFLLDAAPPVVLLAEAETKNDRGAVQPLPAAAVGPLRDYLEGRPAGRPVWPGTWAGSAAQMLRRDLAEAGVEHRVEGPDGPLFVDFHGLRHSYVAMLKRAGVTLSQAMRLARHSDPRLTLKVYGREDLAELSEAVGRINPVAPPVAPAPADGRQRMRTGRNGTQRESAGSKPKEGKDLKGDSPEREGK
jgi:integrase